MNDSPFNDPGYRAAYIKGSEQLTAIVVTKMNPPWLQAVRAVVRLAYSLAVFGGCAYLVFWRGESGWLFALAIALQWFRRGL